MYINPTVVATKSLPISFSFISSYLYLTHTVTAGQLLNGSSLLLYEEFLKFLITHCSHHQGGVLLGLAHSHQSPLETSFSSLVGYTLISPSLGSQEAMLLEYMG